MRLTWFRRRGWIIAAAAVACALAALAIAEVLPDRYTAEAVVIVPAASDEGALGNVDQAAKLARTYAQLIPRDEAVLATIATELGIGSGTVEERLEAVNDPGNSLLRLQFRGRSSTEAILGARTAAESVAGSKPVSENIEPSSMTLVRLPRVAANTGDSFLTHLAESVVLVPARAPRSPAGNAGEASNLATTYADLIPEDRVILAKVAVDLRLDPEEVRAQTTVTHDFDTSIIRLAFADANAEVALAGARILAEAVTGPAPISPRISPRSLAIVHLPTETTSQAMPFAKVAILGIILGLGLGLVLMLTWERADARVDDVRILSEESGCAASSLKHVSNESIGALLDRWASLVDHSPARIALLPASASSEQATAGAVERIIQGGFLTRRSVSRSTGTAARESQIVLESGGTPGGESAGEALALSADLIVLVAAEGTRVADLHETIAVLEQFGSTPAWALLAPPRGPARDVYRLLRQEARRPERRRAGQGR